MVRYSHSSSLASVGSDPAEDPAAPKEGPARDKTELDQELGQMRKALQLRGIDVVDVVDGPRPESLAPRTPPTMRLARSLDEAGPRTFVYVDSKGRVRSPARYKAVQALGYGALMTIVAGGTALYTSLFGPVGVLFGVVFAVVALRSLHLTRQINTAALLSSHDQLDDAEVILKGLIERRFLARRLRALAHHNLGAVATRRGEHAEALSHLREAIKLYQSAWRKSPHLRSCQYGEVITLCNLGRATEARQRLLAMAERPVGDYLLVKFWTTDLYVAFSLDRMSIDEADLWERAQRALRITASSGLLGLCSWAYHRVGDEDLAWHLLREAYDRLEGVPLLRTMPPLWRWMEAHRQAAGVAREAGGGHGGE